MTMSVADTPICIVGGGPGGAAVALSLARAGHRRVTLLNWKAASAGPAVGESIPPAALSWLRELKLDHLLKEGGHRPCPGSWSLWGGDQPGFNDFLLDPLGSGYHLDRSLFNDQLLTETAVGGVDVVSPARLTSVTRNHDGYRVEWRTAEGFQEGQYRVLVDASGASASAMRRLSVSRNLYDELVAACAFVDLPEDSSLGDHTLIEASSIGWWYAARLPGNRAILSFTSDWQTVKQAGLMEPERFLHEFGETRLMSERLSPFGIEIPTIVLKAASVAILSGVAGGGERSAWLAVGDAASSYDPISSAGISKALCQGIQAANAIDQWCREEDPQALKRYQDRVFDDFSNHIRLRHGHYQVEYDRQGSGFWYRRIEPGLQRALAEP